MIRRDEVQAVFREMLDLIQDGGLAEKVLDAWALGLEKGGRESLEQLREMPFTLQTDTRGINFLEHTLAVTRSAVGLARAQIDSYSRMPCRINMDHLIAGGLLQEPWDRPCHCEIVWDDLREKRYKRRPAGYRCRPFRHSDRRRRSNLRRSGDGSHPSPKRRGNSRTALLRPADGHIPPRWPASAQSGKHIMAQTFAEKVLARKAGLPEVRTGQIVTLAKG